MTLEGGDGHAFLAAGPDCVNPCAVSAASMCRMRCGAGLMADCLSVSVVVFLSSTAELFVLTAKSSVGSISGWKLRKIVCDGV